MKRPLLLAAALLTTPCFAGAPYAIDDAALIAAAHAAVTPHLRDPSSARYENDYVTPSGTVCGIVYGKNGFGGYSDGDPYFVELGSAPSIEGPVGASRAAIDAGSVVIERWEAVCRPTYDIYWAAKRAKEAAAREALKAAQSAPSDKPSSP